MTDQEDGTGLRVAKWPCLSMLEHRVKLARGPGGHMPVVTTRAISEWCRLVDPHHSGAQALRQLQQAWRKGDRDFLRMQGGVPVYRIGPVMALVKWQMGTPVVLTVVSGRTAGRQTPADPNNRSRTWTPKPRKGSWEREQDV